MWCWRMIEKISSTDHVRNEEVSQTVKDERNILCTIQRRRVNWIGHILHRNCLLIHIIEGKIEGRTEVTGRWWRFKQLPNDLKETTGSWKLKEESLDHTLWRMHFERGYGPVIRQTVARMNFYTVISNMQLSSTHRTHCYISIATIIIPTCHNVTLCVHCIFWSN